MKRYVLSLLLLSGSCSLLEAGETNGTIPSNTSYYTGRNVPVSPHESAETMSLRATQVRPSARQLRYQQYGVIGFIHFNLNTFTGHQWGTGKEDLGLFNPSQLDTNQWIRTFQAAGIKSVILVAKHHDGLRLWPSKHHPRNISKTPFRDGTADLVAEVAQSCRKYGLRLCIYYSPWDKQKPYGTPAYNDLMVAELTDLLTDYGWIDLVWFDGAGIDPKVSGVNMDFDWDRVYATVRSLQPQAIISGAGPDVRWVGNEGGRGRQTEWSVQGIHRPEKDFSGFDSEVPVMAKELGDISHLLKDQPIQLAWYPARGGLPVRRQWFWRPDQKTRPLSYLVTSFFETVGSNSGLLVNLSPDQRGLIPSEDVALMEAFGAWRAALFATDHAAGAVAKASQTRPGGHHPNYLFDDDLRTGWAAPKGQCTGEITIDLPEAKSFDVIFLQEMIVDFGQRIEEFEVDAEVNGQWETIGAATTVGMRRLLRVTPSTTRHVRVRITRSRQAPSLAHIELLAQPPVAEPASSPESHKLLSRDTWKTHPEVVDGDLSTCWSAEIYANAPVHLDIDLGKETFLSRLTYVPPQGSPEEPGRIDSFAIFLSKDGKTWSQHPIAKGQFGNIDNNPVPQVIALPEGTRSRFVRLTAYSATRQQRLVRIAEIYASP